MLGYFWLDIYFGQDNVMVRKTREKVVLSMRVGFEVKRGPICFDLQWAMSPSVPVGNH